jgi:hypothetical protein
MIVVPEPSVHRTLVVLATFPEMMDGAGFKLDPATCRHQWVSHYASVNRESQETAGDPATRRYHTPG